MVLAFESLRCALARAQQSLVHRVKHHVWFLMAVKVGFGGRFGE